MSGVTPPQATALMSARFKRHLHVFLAQFATVSLAFYHPKEVETMEKLMKSIEKLAENQGN